MTKSNTTKKVETIDVAELIRTANEIHTESSIVLDYIAKNDLEGLQTLIDTEKEKIEEQGKIIEIIKSSGLNKQEKNCLGLWYTGNMDNWNMFTAATTKWLQPVASLVMSEEFKTFMESDKRLADVKKFVEYLEKK